MQFDLENLKQNTLAFKTTYTEVLNATMQPLLDEIAKGRISQDTFSKTISQAFTQIAEITLKIMTIDDTKDSVATNTYLELLRINANVMQGIGSGGLAIPEAFSTYHGQIFETLRLKYESKNTQSDTQQTEQTDNAGQ